MSYHQPKAFTTEQGFWSQKKKTVWERMKDSFTDGFLFYRIASFMDFTYSASYGTRDIAFFFYQIYHRADIGRDLTPDAGGTLIHGVIPCALRDTCISPATNVCPTSQSTRLKIYPAFGCALSGPFGSLHLDPVLSLPDSLCAHMLLWSPLQRFWCVRFFVNILRMV